ncbi:right-handed parallel beta-helix repeat-containing protein [Qipengyuania sp.]|uniref:right-handed parallel beta-helix repeat-containing protein n=1 Tax=Qipengyuania sp. TaxID=2004515 RepID=UPI0037362995
MNLETILTGCSGGETIDLAGKTIESAEVKDYAFADPVTLRGGTYRASGTKRHAFRLNNCAGLNFEDGEVVGDDRSQTGFLFQHCRDIAMRRMKFRGLRHGVAASQCDGFTLEGCAFRDLRVDAFRSGGSRRVRVISNYATDFHPINTGGKGDHPDFIQFWPLYGSDNSEIEIIGNRFERGDGLPAQGIFVRGIYVDKQTGQPKRPQFGRVIICGNVIDGGLRNGISVSGVASGQVTDNVVLSREGEGFQSFIRISRANVTVRGNVAEKFIGDIDEQTNLRGRRAAPSASEQRATCAV